MSSLHDDPHRYPFWDARYGHSLPAPASDFDAEPTRVVCLNAQWLSHVIGVVARLTRVDAWDGTDEEKQRAIEQANLIVDALASGMECEIGDGEPTDPETIIEYVTRGGGVVALENVLGMITKVYIDYQTNELVVQSGQCCEERFSFGSVLSGGKVKPPISTDPTDPEAPEFPDELWNYLPCAKATTITTVMMDAIDILIDAASSSRLPWEAADLVQREITAIDWGVAPLYNAYANTWQLTVIGGTSELADADIVRELKCRWNFLLPAGPDGVATEWWQQLINTIPAAVDAVIEDETKNQLVTGVYVSVLQSIGPNDLNAITTYNVSQETDDCSCPEGELTYPDGMEWYAEYDFTAQNYNWGILEGIYTAGIGWQGTNNWGSGSRLNQLKSPLVVSNAAGMVRWVEVTWDAGTINPAAAQNGVGFRVVATQSPTAVTIASITEFRSAGSGVWQKTGFWDYGGGDQYVMVDVSIDNISAERITLSGLKMAGVGMPPVHNAIML